jgi:hypothetical protein
LIGPCRKKNFTATGLRRVYYSDMAINWGTVVASLVANVALIGGLLKIFWQNLTDRMLATLKARNDQELERLKLSHAQSLAFYQHEFDKTILVTKVHFETEFSALKEAFQKLAEVRLTLASIRPFMSVANRDETKEDKLKALFERLQKLSAAYNELLATTENLSPFYPKEVYDRIDECRQAAWMEITDVQTSGDEVFRSDWYAQGRRNNERFMKAYATVAGLIRDHIATLAVARTQ